MRIYGSIESRVTVIADGALIHPLFNYAYTVVICKGLAPSLWVPIALKVPSMSSALVPGVVFFFVPTLTHFMRNTHIINILISWQDQLVSKHVSRFGDASPLNKAMSAPMYPYKGPLWPTSSCACVGACLCPSLIYVCTHRQCSTTVRELR